MILFFQSHTSSWFCSGFVRPASPYFIAHLRVVMRDFSFNFPPSSPVQQLRAELNVQYNCTHWPISQKCHTPINLSGCPLSLCLSGANKAHPTNAPLGWDCLQRQANLGQLLSQPVVFCVRLTDLNLFYRKCVCVYRLVTHLVFFHVPDSCQLSGHRPYQVQPSACSCFGLDIIRVLGGALKPRCPQCWQWKQGDLLDFLAPGSRYAVKSESSRRNCIITIDTRTRTWGCFPICYVRWKNRICPNLH